MSSSSIIEIKGTLYQTCVIAADKMWASSKKGVFGRGLINSKSDPKKAERHGCLCEMAFSIWADLPVNFGYMEGGDKGDFIVGGLIFDIKKFYKRGNSLLIVAYQGDRYVFKNHDIYVAVDLDDQMSRANAEIVGYITKDDVLKCPIQPAIRGSHTNYVVEKSKLEDPAKLKKFINDLVPT